jgi:hypothetical protein
MGLLDSVTTPPKNAACEVAYAKVKRRFYLRPTQRQAFMGCQMIFRNGKYTWRLIIRLARPAETLWQAKAAARCAIVSLVRSQDVTQ